MGQSSLPTANRLGFKLFWNNAWDNKFLYRYFLIKFMYLDHFFLKLFSEKFCLNNFIMLKKKKNICFFFKNFFFYSKNIFLKKVCFSLNICTSKLWIFKYQNWIILNIFIYFPNLKVKKKQKFLSKIQKNKNFFFIQKWKKFNFFKLKKKRKLKRKHLSKRVTFVFKYFYNNLDKILILKNKSKKKFIKAKKYFNKYQRKKLLNNNFKTFFFF